MMDALTAGPNLKITSLFLSMITIKSPKASQKLAQKILFSTIYSFFCLIVMLVSGCDSSVKWRSGKYEVYWLDVSSELCLGRTIRDNGRIGRVMPQVFAVGENGNWLVAARYPDGDRSRKEYFYLSKDRDDDFKNAAEVVKGPFTYAEFKKKQMEIGLPDLTITF